MTIENIQKNKISREVSAQAPAVEAAKTTADEKEKLQELQCSLEQKRTCLQKLETCGLAVGDLKTRTEQALAQLQEIMAQLGGTV